jgi:hypothetical protein
LLIGAALGFVATIPQAKSLIDPWMVSAFTTAAGGLEWIRRKATRRAKANAWYARRDEVEALRQPLCFQMPGQPSDDQLALISREYVESKKRYGARMAIINAREDEPITKGKETPAGGTKNS